MSQYCVTKPQRGNSCIRDIYDSTNAFFIIQIMYISGVTTATLLFLNVAYVMIKSIVISSVLIARSKIPSNCECTFETASMPTMPK